MIVLSLVSSLLLLFSLANAQVPQLSGAPASMGAGTYPRVTKLSDGSLLGGFTARDGETRILRTLSSRDNGATWQAKGEISRAVADMDNISLIQLPGGKVLAAFRNNELDRSWFRVTICSSDDGGVNWKFVTHAAENGGTVQGLWEPFFRLANDNTLQLYYSKENAGNDQDSLLRTSTNGGANWSNPITISGGDVTARDGMLGVAKVGNTGLVAVFETTQGEGGRFVINAVSSNDDGRTWGQRRRVYTPTANNAGAPQIVSVGNTLVASFMTDEDTNVHNWPSGAAMKVVVSTDGGLTWKNKATMAQPEAFWPGLYAVDSNSFLALYDRGGSKAQRVVLV